MPQFKLENQVFDIDAAGSPVSECELIEFEKKIGTKLPSQLRSFYSHWNGGLPYPNYISEDKCVWVRLSWQKGTDAVQGGTGAIFEGLFRINADPSIDFYSNWIEFKQSIPNDVICFAYNPGSSLFLIGIREYNLGKIFFWSSAYQANIGEGEIPNYDNIAFVANSFTEFLLALREEPNDGESLEDWAKRVYEK